MGISVKRIVLTFILAILFVIAFGWVIMMQNHATLVRNQSGDETLQREEMTQTRRDIESAWDILHRRIEEQYKVDAALLALALRNIIQESGDKAIALYSDGAVIKIEDGAIIAPDNTDRRLGLTADMFKDREGIFASPRDENTLVIYSRISGPYYYVEWDEDTSIDQETEDALDIPDILRKAEAAYNVFALCYVEDPDAENGARILYCNDIIPNLAEVFQKEEKVDISSYESEDEISCLLGTVTMKNVTFNYVQSPVPEIDGVLILMSVRPNLYRKALSQGTYMFTALILFLAALIMTGIWLYYYIRSNALTESLERWYKPSYVRRFTALYGVIGAILIFLSGMLIYALNGLYDDSAAGKERLRSAEQSLSMYSDRVKQNMERFLDIYLEYGEHIAEVLDNYPQLRDQSVLETLADTISASSITLYDADGNETASSEEYIGLTLGLSPESVTHDFRRILNGVPSIVHEVETDEVTGESGIRVAVRIKDSADPSRFGVMVICVDPELLDINFSQMADTVLQNMAGENVVLCIADQESGEILFSGKDDLVHRNVSVIGMDTGKLQNSYIGTVVTDSGSLFVITSVMGTFNRTDGAQTSENMTAVYAAPDTSNAAGMLSSSLAGSVMFVVIYAILAWMVLGGYTDDFYEKHKKLGRPVENRKKGWEGVRDYFASIRPEKIGLVTMELIVGLYLIQQIPIANFDTALSRNSVYYYINSGNWEKGLNLFAIAGILLLLGQILMVVIGIRILLTCISTFVGAKGKTICRLIRSLTMYLALFLFLIMSMNYLGLSMSAILAAIGTLGIAVSLGAQHFVSDIIAGLTMVFEGTVHVGDIVDLGAGSKMYHGTVQEIGLRFIRIINYDGNIVALNNRDINMTTNMTKLNSWCRCEFTVSSEYAIEEIDEIMQRELPEIGKQDLRILKGPDYQGIIALEGGKMTFLITAECREKDMSAVHQIIIRSVQQILTKAGYRI